MCRWRAYLGSPVRIEDLLFEPTHSLIAQSLHSQLGAETTNGDGFGIGWYGVGDTPGTFHSVDDLVLAVDPSLYPGQDELHTFRPIAV